MSSAACRGWRSRRIETWSNETRLHDLRVLRLPPSSRDLHAVLWKAAAAPGFARRRIYDLRIALCLQAFGVTDFATANVKHFEDAGFARVWNPLSS